LTGLCVAFLRKITKWEPTTIDVIAPKRRQVKGVRVRECRSLDARDVTVVNGIPVTTVARMLVDVSDDHPADVLANLIHEAAFLRLFSLPATRDAMERAKGRHNLDVLQAALHMHESGSAGTRSKLERRFRRLVRGAGLPAPITNTIVNGFEVDAYWPGLCVEIDSPLHERTRTQVDDRIRDAALRAAGYTVLRFRDTDIDRRPAWVLAQLAAQQLPGRIAR
jgi:very-short-patch-repair endonuclease